MWVLLFTGTGLGSAKAYDSPFTILFLSNMEFRKAGISKGLSQNENHFLVVIDPGHGGRDIGTSGRNSVEKDIALQLCLKIEQKLRSQYPYIDVILTRKEDIFVSLEDRIALANFHKADLFVSIHCNAANNSTSASGVETYVLGVHDSKENLLVAKRENASIFFETNYEKTYEGFDPHGMQGYILLEARHNAYLDKSIELAQIVQAQIALYTPLKNRSVRQAGFILLKKAMMPGILIETAFLTNQKDETFLSSPEGQDRLAASIAHSIARFGFAQLRQETPEKLREHNKTIVYTIQVAAVANKKKIKDYGELKHLKNVDVKYEDNMYKYFVGQYDYLETALDASIQLRDQGITGAFVVAREGGVSGRGSRR